MYVGTPKALAMAGAMLIVAIAPQAFAQGNPFMPPSAASKATVEKIVDERMKAMEARLKVSIEEAAQKSAPHVPGVPGAPGVPSVSGAGVPGGMLPPGAVGPGGPIGPGVPGGSPIAPPEPPKGEIEAARENGVRFIGCINGVPKFTRQSGERVTFSKAHIAEAVKAGFLPACR